MSRRVCGCGHKIVKPEFATSVSHALRKVPYFPARSSFRGLSDKNYSSARLGMNGSEGIEAPAKLPWCVTLLPAPDGAGRAGGVRPVGGPKGRSRLWVSSTPFLQWRGRTILRTGPTLLGGAGGKTDGDSQTSQWCTWRLPLGITPSAAVAIHSFLFSVAPFSSTGPSRCAAVGSGPPPPPSSISSDFVDALPSPPPACLTDWLGPPPPSSPSSALLRPALGGRVPLTREVRLEPFTLRGPFATPPKSAIGPDSGDWSRAARDSVRAGPGAEVSRAVRLT